MSAFCVFGVTYDSCKRQVQKKLDPITRDANGALRPMTTDEYAAAVEEKAIALFTKSKAKQVSPAFDAPQFAKEWVEVAKRTQARALKIMRKGEKIDPKGAPVLKNGKPVIGWIPFAG